MKYDRELELFQEILIHILSKENIKVSFPDFEVNIKELLELESYQALRKIKAIIENDSLSEFMCIEEIIQVLESVGSDGGSRFDF